MDFTAIWESIAGQEPVFLAATGSVALGITLILMAGIVPLKRVRTWARPEAPAEEPRTLPTAVVAPEHHQSRTEPARNPELRHLMTRLRAAADKLEHSTAANADYPDNPADSPLKKVPSGVEYIFRAGTG